MIKSPTNHDDEDPKFVTEDRIADIIQALVGHPAEKIGSQMADASERDTDAAILAHLNTIVSMRRQMRKDDPRLLVLAAAQAKWPGISINS
ncbi:hypothetical protein PROFUN_15891 [Planoprotostelium fungivorum]|uniref:Uncharacterized protein n=1 Tax=Planoprotostelium fungivorum TaxID=1890364 RepID=A0A2P6MU88_9EUKA|nr:hypothetical protein PROFUN_15891 [Planoprotostelium fungivorum]